MTLGSTGNGSGNSSPATLTYHYFHNDPLGSSQRLTNDQGVLIWSARVEAFGKTTTIDSIITNLVNRQSQTALMPTTTVNNLRFPGQIEDGETGPFYNWHRDYVPVTGHYIESDPIGLAGGVNTYVYVSGRPIRKVDSFGLWATDAHNYFIRRAFPNLPSDMRAAIERGSANADRWAYQDDCNSYMHAMSSACLTVAKARKKMCKYVKTNLSSYNNLLQSNDIGSQIGAYFLLGMALHPIMDSTSPEHRGFQYWDTATNWKEHGPWPTSKEKGEVARETQYSVETLELMRLAVAGDLSLIGCQ